MAPLAFIRRTLLRWSLGFSRWLGRLHLPYTHKRIVGAHFYRARELLQPGDVLMSRTEGEPTNLFIPGFWSHGAVYAGEDRVVEAVGEGVVLTDLASWMLSKDAVRVCRARFADEATRAEAAQWAVSFVGRPYDYAFEQGNQSFYCFEITYVVYQLAMNAESPWKLRRTMGVETVVGDDFDRAPDKWAVLWDSRDWATERRAGRLVLVDKPAA